MALVPPERSSKRYSKGPKHDRLASTTRRTEGREIVQNRHLNLDVPSNISLYALLREWAHDNPSLFPDYHRQVNPPRTPTFQYRALEHQNLREPPTRATSSEEDFEAAIQNQDTSITVESHIDHWKDAQTHWVTYFERQHALEDNRELLACILAANGD